MRRTGGAVLDLPERAACSATPSSGLGSPRAEPAETANRPKCGMEAREGSGRASGGGEKVRLQCAQLVKQTIDPKPLPVEGRNLVRFFGGRRVPTR